MPASGKIMLSKYPEGTTNLIDYVIIFVEVWLGGAFWAGNGK
jgi:hypothetical protein